MATITQTVTSTYSDDQERKVGETLTDQHTGKPLFQPRRILSIDNATGGSLGASRLNQVVHQDQSNIPHDPVLLLDNFDNHVAIDKPSGAGDHPHRGFQIITYLSPESTGSMLHEDSQGGTGILAPGGMQWLHCGRGVVHNEGPESAGSVFGLQLWLRVPAQNRLDPARYRDYAPLDITEVEQDGVRVRIVSGTALGASAQQTSTGNNIIFLHFYLQPGASINQPIAQGDNAFVYVFHGTATVNDATVLQRQRATLANDGTGDGVTLRNDTNEVVDLVLLGGTPQPADQTTIVWGPFVGGNEQEILSAFEDYKVGRNGFENAPTWQSSRGHALLKGRRRYTQPPVLNADGTLPKFNQKDYILPPI